MSERPQLSSFQESLFRIANAVEDIRQLLQQGQKTPIQPRLPVDDRVPFEEPQIEIAESRVELS